MIQKARSDSLRRKTNDIRTFLAVLKQQYVKKRLAFLRRSTHRIRNSTYSSKVSGLKYTKLSVTTSIHQEWSMKSMRLSRKPTSIAPFQTKRLLYLKKLTIWSFVLSLWSAWITKLMSHLPAKQQFLLLSLDSATKLEKTRSQISRKSWIYAISLGITIWSISMWGFKTRRLEILRSGNTKPRRSWSRKERKRSKINLRNKKMPRRRKNKR